MSDDLVDEPASDSKSLSHVIKHKMLGSQMESTEGQDALLAIGGLGSAQFSKFGNGSRSNASRGKSMNAVGVGQRRHVVNRSKGLDHGQHLEYFVENVTNVPGQQEQRSSQLKSMTKTAYGAFAKKSIFKDPNQLIFTNKAKREEVQPLSGSRSVVEQIAFSEGVTAGRKRRDVRKRQILQASSHA